MVQKVNITLVDDLDGSEGNVETVKFGLDGALYEIDLTSKNANKLRKDLEKYVSAGRKQIKRRQRRNTTRIDSV